jgi:hypothetical protein
MLATLLLLLSASASDPTTSLQTTAERTAFAATSDYDGTLAFLRELERRAPFVRLSEFGRSAEGRALPLVVVSKERQFTPEKAAASGKPLVMIQNGIHAGEIDGKDACLILLRDMAQGRHTEILDAINLLIVPIYNVDGHERISPYNRPNQDGPREGMGFRTTSHGLDLNRDHLKLVSAEARALIGLFNRWRPHLHVDDHVTDGSDHAWVFTYSWAESPQVAPSIDAWAREELPAVLEATREAGHPLGPYVDLVDRSDPSRGFSSIAGEPRYSGGYFPLRNRLSILVENHSYKPFEARVRANHDFLLALLRQVARRPAALVDAVAAAERRTVKRGRAADPPPVVVRYAEDDVGDTVRWPVYSWSHEPSLVMGVPLLRFVRGDVDEREVPWIHRYKAELTLPRPRGYVVLPGWPQIESRLRAHGLRVERITRAASQPVETIRLENPAYARGPYQGLTRVDTFDVARAVETREIPRGALWIPADQPDFEVAVQLLEPEAPDSLLRWGLLSTVFERKEYIEPSVLEPLVEEMLADPSIAAAWQRALEDEAFAGNPWARWVWWYRRTPYWDERVGLLPVYRVVRPFAPVTEEWP